VFRTYVLATHSGTFSSTVISYRNMCRFNSGVSAPHRWFKMDFRWLTFLQYFFRHELLTPYKWYWRVESVVHHIHELGSDPFCRPDVRYYCDLDYDPFRFMEEHDKVYGELFSL